MRADIFSSNDVYIGFGGHEQLPVGTSSYCVVWSSRLRDTYFDGAWKSGLAFAVLATIFSGVAMILSFFFACFSFDTIWIKVCGYMLMMASLFEFLTFIGFASDICSNSSCKFSVGAGLAILGGVNALLTAGMFSKIPPYEEPQISPGLNIAGDDLAPGTVQVTEQVLPDGTKRTIKTTVREDGSRVVEETVQVSATEP
jgi:hypothetical protein